MLKKAVLGLEKIFKKFVKKVLTMVECCVIIIGRPKKERG